MINKTIIIIFSILFCFQIILVQEGRVKGQVLSKTDSLKIEKLELEVKILNDETQKSIISFLVQVIGGLSVIFTVFYGFKNYRSRTIELRNKEISKIVESLHSTEEHKRLGAAMAMKQYCNYLVDESLSILSHENSKLVPNAIKESLLSCNKKNQNKICNNNSQTIERTAEILGKYHAIDQKKTLNILEISPRHFKSIVKSNHINHEHGNYFKSEENDIQNIKSEIDALVNIRNATAEIIGKLLQANTKSIRYLNNNFLSTLNLYKTNFDKFIIHDTIFTGCLMRHSSFKHTQLINCDFFGSDLLDSKFSNMLIKNSDFNKARLLDSSFYKSNIINNNFILSQLDRTKFIKSHIELCKFKKAKLRKAQFINSTIYQSYLDSINAEQSKFEKSLLQNLNMKGAILLEAEFNKCNFIEVELIGADLRGSIFTNCTFNKVDFTSVKHNQETKFINCKPKNPIIPSS